MFKSCKAIMNSKNVIVYSILFFAISLSSCKENCIECTDNISAENKKIPYKNKDLIAFKNDTLGSVYDTVYVDLGDFSGCYKKKYYETYEDLCSKSTIIKFSNKFNLHIYQSPNIGYNIIYYLYSDDWILNVSNELATIQFNKKNYDVIHYYFPVDSVGSKIWIYNSSRDSSFVYNDYFIIQNDSIIKLLQYTTVYKDGTRRVWRLQED